MSQVDAVHESALITQLHLLNRAEKLAAEGIEFERLKLIAAGSMRTPDTLANGWGAATPARLQATLDETITALGLKPGLTVADIWTDKFLPTAADRKLKA